MAVSGIAKVVVSVAILNGLWTESPTPYKEYWLHNQQDQELFVGEGGTSRPSYHAAKPDPPLCTKPN